MPDWSSALRDRLAKLQLTPVREAEIVDELSQHLEDRVGELRGQGIAEHEACRLAVAELDELDDRDLLAREMKRLRQARSSESIVMGQPRRRWLADIWKDTVYSLRLLRKQPGFAAAAVATLALGIGANSAIFSVINATLFQRLPVANRDRLFYLFGGNGGLSYPGYSALRDGNTTFDGIAAWGGITASLNADGQTDLVNGLIVTGNLFEVLGVPAERGRVLGRADDVTPGAHPVAVISHRLWKTRFGERPDIVNSQIRLNGQLFTVVGTTAADFPGPQPGAMCDLYVPMMMQAVMRPPRAGYSGEMDPDLLRRNAGWLATAGLLKRGVAPAQAEAELFALWATYWRSVNPNVRPMSATLVPIDASNPTQRREMRSIAILLGSVVGAVLLIACANVANLLLSKAAARRREIALRLSIGANRWRIVRQLLTESLVLALCGGAAGVGLAFALVAIARAAPPPAGSLPISIELVIDQRVLLFTLSLSLLTGIVFGVAPAIQASRPQLVAVLKDDAVVLDARSRRVNLRHALVVAEVGLSILLLVAAGLFIRSLRSMQTIDPGIATDKLLSAPLGINLLRYTKAQGRAFYEDAIARVEALPGVESAAVARVGVLTGGARLTSFHIEGAGGPADRARAEGLIGDVGPNQIKVNIISPRFFETLGISLLKGRGVTTQDAADSTRICLLNQTAARLNFPADDAIGKRVSFEGPRGPWVEIVGIVRDSKYSFLREAPQPVAYLPLSQNHETGMTLYVRAAVPPASLVGQVRRELQAIEPNLPVPNIETMAETIGTSLYVPRMVSALLTVFGILALVLASVGVYGVLAFSISRRTRELGIRLALGAEARSLFALVVREGMSLVAVGVALGLVGAFIAARSLAAVLYGVESRDVAATFAIAPVLLAGVALAACVVPARRAMKVDPVITLKST